MTRLFWKWLTSSSTILFGALWHPSTYLSSTKMLFWAVALFNGYVSSHLVVSSTMGEHVVFVGVVWYSQFARPHHIPESLYPHVSLDLTTGFTLTGNLSVGLNFQVHPSMPICMWHPSPDIDVLMFHCPIEIQTAQPYIPSLGLPEPLQFLKLGSPVHYSDVIQWHNSQDCEHLHDILLHWYFPFGYRSLATMQKPR